MKVVRKFAVRYHFSKSFCLIAFIFLLNIFSNAQGVLNNVSNRQKTSLNGNWNYIIDPYEMGYYNFRMEAYDQNNPNSSSAFYNNYHAKNKQELVEYDFDKSPVMMIPNDWNSQNEKLFFYEGTVWFKKTFDYN